jgi:hypothetical protein
MKDDERSPRTSEDVLAYDEPTDDELRLLLARSAEANGWNEPEMDAYDRYDEERRRLCP